MAKLHKQKKMTVSPRGRKLDIWFDHLNPRQDIRSGDTLCLDYRSEYSINAHTDTQTHTSTDTHMLTCTLHLHEQMKPR